MATFGSQTGKLAPQSVLAQRYMLVQVAGRGGMSAIYQAVDLKQGRQPVAIKEMSLENLSVTERQEALVRFQQEAHLLETLSHPNLPRIYDAFSEGGRSFLVMDYIDGRTLLQLLQTAGQPLPVEQVMNYADQLCDVLVYLHGQNPPVIFRDLKPTNVMVTQEGHVYLIDFGIARFFKEGQSQDTVVLGSPGYAPPEQHGLSQTDARSDLYALGATLHCCLSNRDPYQATERFVFAPVRQFNSQVPTTLDELILRMVAPDARLRPASALEVKQALAGIRQQVWTGGAAPVTVASSAPTQYIQPSQQPYQPTMPMFDPRQSQAKLILPAVPISPIPTQPGAGYPPTVYPTLPPLSARGGRGPVARARVWTPGFFLVFLLLLVLTVGGSMLAFNIANPYGSGNHAGLDHATEAALAALALFISLLSLGRVRSAMAGLAVVGSVIALLIAGAAFVLQTLRDIQNSVLAFGQLPLNAMLSFGLLTAGVISLLWLAHRSLTWVNRILLLLFFGFTALCALLQIPYLDNAFAVTKHLLLLSALIVFIQGTLLAGQMARRSG